MQRSVALEKACVLFNLGALFSQSAAGESRDTPEVHPFLPIFVAFFVKFHPLIYYVKQSLDRAIEHFQYAAAIFQHVFDNFGNSPSADLSPPTLRLLASLMHAQCQECLLIKHATTAPSATDGRKIAR